MQINKINGLVRNYKIQTGLMYKFQVSQNSGTFSRDNLPRSRQKDSRQIMFEDIGSRELKQNDSKHMNAIKPYVNKERKNSKREIKPVSSQGEINRSRSKRLESTSSNRKSVEQQQSSMISCENISLLQGYPSVIRQKPSSEITKIYQQMITLKSQYKELKTSYNNLVRQKQLATSRQENSKLSYQRQSVQLKQQIQKHKKTNTYLQSQIQRIKRQCFKIIQSEKFKYKKLEQTLQEKELMIAYLRKQIQLLKRQRINMNSLLSINANNKQQLNVSMSQVQQDNLQRIFFLQNSAPIFSYESYARLSANTSAINGSGNVLIQQSQNSSQTPTRMGNNHDNHKKNHKKRSQYEQDSLSFSRDKSKQFDSVHSLLSVNNHNEDQTILTFTKKDVIVLDQSFQNCLQNFNKQEQKCHSQNQQPQCPTFQNRRYQPKSKQKDKQIISFQSLKAKRMLSKSDRAQSKRSNKNSKIHTKRLQIMTDPYPDQKDKDKYQDQYSCDTKKKLSKNKIKNSKKVSKSQGLHNSIMSEVLHGSFIKKDSSSMIQSKSLHSNNSKRK